MDPGQHLLQHLTRQLGPSLIGSRLVSAIQRAQRSCTGVCQGGSSEVALTQVPVTLMAWLDDVRVTGGGGGEVAWGRGAGSCQCAVCLAQLVVGVSQAVYLLLTG